MFVTANGRLKYTALLVKQNIKIIVEHPTHLFIVWQKIIAAKNQLCHLVLYSHRCNNASVCNYFSRFSSPQI